MNNLTETLQRDDDERFRELMRGVRGGSPDAIRDLVREYEGPIRGAVRRALHPKLRSGFDSLDFVQLAWRSFFRARKHAERIETLEDFIRYMGKMACNKVRAEDRRRRARRHDVRREVPLHTAYEEVVAREPEPVDTVIAQERLEQVLKNQSPRRRKIIQMRVQGNTFAEIGTRLNIDLHTAQRFISRLAKRIFK